MKQRGGSEWLSTVKNNLSLLASLNGSAQRQIIKSPLDMCNIDVPILNLLFAGGFFFFLFLAIGVIKSVYVSF